jgi:DNA-binding CsgD family transcriptional regulator
MLLDREAEKRELDHVLTAVRGGFSGVLVLRGESGVGKTALLEYVTSSGNDLRVARAVGVESEMELGFGTLHQLLGPFLDRLPRLPGPQRDALGSAFGIVESAAVDRFRVGLAALTLLADVAASRALLCVIDDAQWLDHVSAQVLGFVARRLFADRVGMVFAVRDPSERGIVLDGLPELRLGGLPDTDARALLASVAPGKLDPRVGDRIVSETRGNPLALIELGSGKLTVGELAGMSRLPEPLPVGTRLEQVFLRRVLALPADAQTFLLLAAADTSGDPALLLRAAGQLGIGREVVALPGLVGLLTVERHVEFRHPLIRSAVYHGARAAARRRAHEALAAAIDPGLDADRRAWHLAAAAPAPDKHVAAELERSADRARDRGGWASSAAFHTRAAELTPDTAPRRRRLLSAAQAELNAGAPSRALALLDRARGPQADQLEQAPALRLRGNIAFALGDGSKAAAALSQAALAFQPHDLRLARESLLEAMEAAFWAGRSATLEVARAAAAIPRSPAPQTTLTDVLLEGFAALAVGGYDTAAQLLRRAIERLRADDLAPDEGVRWLQLGCWACSELFDEEAWRALNNRHIQLARDHGALIVLPVALDTLGELEVYCGRFDRAEACVSEGREIAAATGKPQLFGSTVTEMLLLAFRGRAPELREANGRLVRTSKEHGQGLAETVAQFLLCILNLGLGRYAEALQCGQDVFVADAPETGTMVVPYIVEAASRIGDTEVAATALARLEERARASGTTWALGRLALSRALVADDALAQPLYAEALEQLESSEAAVDRARAHLLYGEWLRRQRRKRDARDALRIAYEMLDAIGAEAFAEHARQELLATGEHLRRRAPETRDELTPREAHIAMLASEGASNQEIAAQLFISPSTVAYHLRKVFRKLDVSNRTRLAAALNAEPHDAPCFSPALAAEPEDGSGRRSRS